MRCLPQPQPQCRGADSHWSSVPSHPALSKAITPHSRQPPGQPRQSTAIDGGGSERQFPADLDTESTSIDAYRRTSPDCRSYDETQIPDDQDESDLTLRHFDGSGWTDITSSLDTVNDIICGETTTLSPFAVMVPTSPSVGGIVEIVAGPSDTPDAQPRRGGYERELAALAVALAAAGVVGTSWHRFRRRVG